MSYTHVFCNRGAIHAQDDGSNWTVCGKEITHTYDEVGDPITCKVCARSIDLSRDHRIARKLSELVRELHEDMISRPGAYLHTDRNAIHKMKKIVEGE